MVSFTKAHGDVALLVGDELRADRSVGEVSCGTGPLKTTFSFAMTNKSLPSERADTGQGLLTRMADGAAAISSFPIKDHPSASTGIVQLE